MTVARPEYLAFVWPPLSDVAGRRVEALTRDLDQFNDWHPAGETDRIRLWTLGDAGERVRRLGRSGGFLVGDIYPRSSDSAMRCGPGEPATVARRLAETCWGRYVAILQDPAEGATATFRDPSGDLDCQTWTLGDGVYVVSSDMRLTPAPLRPPRLTLDWDRIAAFTATHSAMSLDMLFDGAAAVVPGTLQPMSEGRAVTIWTPAQFAGANAHDEAAASRELVARVDESVAVLTAPYPHLIAEVSGGLDSAIIAAALDQVGRVGNIVQWLNRRGERPEGDERSYARTVTDRLGVALTSTVKSATPLTETDFAELGSAVWPSINGIDAARDRDAAERLRATGASAVVSGQGGDAVFFQMPTVLLAAEEVRRRGVGALTSPLLVDLARRTRTSVWRVLADAWPHRRSAALPSLVSPLVSGWVRDGVASLVHPWVREAADLPPAKQLQVRAIANAHIHRGDCRQRRVADLVFPLLAQPVVELCLSIPAPILAGGTHDRRFARAAFAQRLPDAVQRRRSKGDLTAYFAQLAAASLPALRPWLLDGCLSEAGVLDRNVLDRALRPQALITGPIDAELLCAAAVEGWVRYWQGRVPDSLTAARFRPAA